MSNNYEYQKQRRQKKKEAGICIQCSNASLPNRFRCQECVTKSNKLGTISNSKAKFEVLTHYSKDKELQCCWPDCKINDIDILTIDHMNDDGAKDRKQRNSGRGGVTFYKLLRSTGFPIGFQTLCWNHQAKKEILRRREGKKYT